MVKLKVALKIAPLHSGIAKRDLRTKNNLSDCALPALIYASHDVSLTPRSCDNYFQVALMLVGWGGRFRAIER